jgi:SAM-dependent methyltransferase
MVAHDRGMFNQSAAWYDAFYRDKNYAGEADQVATLIQARHPQASTLLDVGCGTGRHLEHLCAHFVCVGVDLDPGLLTVARRRLPEVPLVQADMTEFDLGRRFDAVTCLFSSIGYVGSVERLHAAVGCVTRHLHPDGVLIVEPWILPDAWIEGVSLVDVVEEDGRKLVRVITSRRADAMTILRMHYAVAAHGEITSVDERHELGLFTKEEYLQAFARAGLDATWDPDGLTGRGLLVGARSKDDSPQRL